MIATKKIKKYLVNELTPIREALQTLEHRKSRALICVNDQGILKGTLSFGDINRWLISSEKVDLDEPVSKVMYCTPKFIHDYETPNFESLKKFHLVPVIDQLKRVQKVITFGKTSKILELGQKQFTAGKPFIIA